MYAGDETGGLVIDTGHFSTKAGYAGDDCPKCILPSVVTEDPALLVGHGDDDDDGGGGGRFGLAHGRGSAAAAAEAATTGRFAGRRGGLTRSADRLIVGDAALMRPRPGQRIRGPLLDGSVQDWDALEALWRAAAVELRMDPAESPLLLTEPVTLADPQRERYLETAMEGLGAPATYLLRSPVASAFGAGLPTATVVDLGYQHSRSTCVVDGFALQRTVQQHPWGQQALDLLSVALMRDAVAGTQPRPDHAQLTPTGSPGHDPAAVSPEAARDAFDAGDIAPRYAVSRSPPRRGSGFTPSTSSSSSSSGGGGGGGDAGVRSYVTGMAATAHPSYHAYMLASLGREFRESVAQVTPVPFSPEMVVVDPVTFVLPDGTSLEVGAARALLTETLFAPEAVRPLVRGGEQEILARMTREAGWAHGAAGLAAWGQGVDVSTGVLRRESDGPRGSAAAPEQTSSSSSSASSAAAGDASPTDGGAAAGGGTSRHGSAMSSADPIHEGLGGRDPAAVYRFGRRMRVLMRASSTTGAVEDTVPAPMALHQAVSMSMMSADADSRKALSSNILLCGGGSLLPGIATRVQSELAATLTGAFRPRVVSGLAAERQFSAWLGGSITASLGTFQQLWISKQEYDEEGPGIVDRRCG